MTRRKRWLLPLVSIVALVAAALYIYPPGKFQLNRRRAEGESSLRAIESLRGVLPGIDTAVTDDTTFQPGASGGLSPQNTVFVHAEDLADLGADSPIAFRFCDSDLKRAAFLVRNGRFPEEARLSPLVDTPWVIDFHVDLLARVKYAVVIREQRYDAPKLLDNGEFDSGYYEGEALFFEIPSRKLLGRFSIEGSNEFLIRTRDMPQNALLTDLGDQVRKNLKGEVIRRYPAFGDQSNADAPCSDF